MSVLGRVLLSSGERVDLSDLLSIDSYTAGDLQNLLTAFVGSSTPYIIQGFDVADPQNAVGTQSCSINVANAAVFYPSSTSGPFFFGLSNATALVPELRQNSVNYIYLTLTTVNTSSDTRAFWDPDSNGGVGGEFTQEVNTESVLSAQVGVSIGSFPTGSVPLAIVTMGAVVITSIEDARPLMFRLGTGGVSPNPYNTFSWPALPNSSYEREEPPNTVTAGGVNPFQGADKNIQTLKQWMDAIMTKLKELGGTTYWYEDTSTYSLVSIFTDALATAFKTKGQYEHSSATPGLFTWTEDINIKVTSDPRTYIIRAGNVTLANEQVAYLDLIRGGTFNSTDQSVSWTNGQTYVNSIGGAIGLFANLVQGDWVKRPTDPDNYYLRVEQFYDSVNLGGSVTTAANAKSILLSGTYQGPTITDVGRRDQGVYSSSAVVVSNRSNSAIDALGGNFSWLALRSDTIEGISSAVTTSLTASVSAVVGGVAQVTTNTAHGLLDGDYITITNSTNFNGTYSVTVDSSTVVSIDVANTYPTETLVDVYYAIVTTSAYSTPYGLQLESADHGFTTGDTVIISNTTNYNGSYLVSVRNSTQFQIGVSNAWTTESSGNATLAKILVRADEGSVTVVQGGSVNPDGVIANIQSFIGMTSDAQSYPNYSTSGSYNTLFGQYNFNSLSTDNVTTRLSNLTAMMADRAQDRTLQLLAVNLTSVNNTSAGSNQTITFNSSASLSIVQPGSPGNATVSLSSQITLGTNQVAYVTINRNSSSTPTILVSNISALAPAENTVIIATRLSGTDIYLWDGTVYHSGYTVPTQGQLQLVAKTSGTTTRVRITGANQLIYNGPSEIESISGLIMDFSGAEVDFATGNIYSGDATQPLSVDFTTPLGINFTPKTIAANEYFWYAIGLVPAAVQSDNTMSVQVIIQPASTYGSTAINAPKPVLSGTVKLGAVLVQDNGSGGSGTILAIQESNIDQLSVGQGSGGSGLTSVNLYDPYDTALPTGTVTIDNVSVTAGMLVLFSALVGGNNQVYQAQGTGSSITGWQAQPSFNSQFTPIGGSTVIITQGQGFANQIGEFNGTTWQFNYTVRYFNGGDYWEQTSIVTSTLADNSTGNVFTVNYTGSEYMVIDYSINRGTIREVGSLYVTTDGTNVSVSTSGTNLNGVSGVTFSGTISGSLIELVYTTTSTGTAATMKYIIKRWSNAAGGPGGVPNYSGYTPSGGTAAGVNESIQFNNSGALAGSSNFLIDTSNNVINMNGLQHSILNGPVTINDNVSSPATLFSYPAATFPYMIVEYSVVRNGLYRVGRFLVANDGTIASLSDDYAETAITGTTFSASILGSNVLISYTSTATGYSGNFKYSVRRWS